MGVPVEGRFKKFDAQVAFDPAGPATSKVVFTVDTSSATLVCGDGCRTAEGRLVQCAQVPQATFESTAIKAVGAGRYEGGGKLSIGAVA